MSQSVLQKKIIIPVQVMDLSIFDDAFSSMRERFAAEMKLVDEQMNKFSSDLMRLYGQTSTIQLGMATSQNSPGTWENLTESPLVEGEGENRALKLKFDVSQFDPNEVAVKIMNDILIVTARHEEKTDNSAILKEYNREFLLPKGINPEKIVSSLSKDGILVVQAPLPKQLENTLIRPQLALK